MLYIIINNMAASIIKKLPAKVKTLKSIGYLLLDFTNLRCNLEEIKYEAKPATAKIITVKKISIRSFYGL